MSSCLLIFHWPKPVRWPNLSQFGRRLPEGMNTVRGVSLEAINAFDPTMIPDFLQNQHTPI